MESRNHLSYEVAPRVVEVRWEGDENDAALPHTCFHGGAIGLEAEDENPMDTESPCNQG